jgi:3-methyladenine DNA glycosylase AlkD
MNSEQLLDRIQADLEQHADAEYRVHAAEYTRRDVDRYIGVKTPTVRKIASKYYKEIKNLGIDAILDLCEELLETRISEHKTIAFQWAFRCRREYQPQHFEVLESWLERYVDSWGSCDDLCTHSLGAFFVEYPELVPRVREWCLSQNRWFRRASAVSLIYGARRGRYLDHMFEVADSLLTDSDDMVQKGCGWMLKVASETYQQEVFEYVIRNKKSMPRTVLRYAIEKMPEDLRREAMKKDW